jgi:uncharacterized membrane protein YqjE
MVSDGKFPEIFTGGNFPFDVRASIFTCLFFTVLSMFREIFTVLSMLFIVLSMFWETFRKFSSLSSIS